MSTLLSDVLQERGLQSMSNCVVVAKKVYD